MQYVWVILLFLPSALSQSDGRFRVVVPEAPVSSVSGSDVVLSCSVREFDRQNIMKNAVDLTVTWSRPDLKDSLVHLYENHKNLNTDQNPSYRGRTAVFKEELKNGDVSLKLSNVRITDEGEYTCRVDSKFWEDSKTIKLSVEAVGSEPVITMEKYESGKFSLLCESKGWYPEPELQWKNSKGVNVTAETETQAVADLFNVKSRITVEEIDSYYCSVTQRVHEKEERIDAQSLHGTHSPSLLQGWTHPEYTGKFEVVGPEAPVFSVSGSDVVLPCSVRELGNPNIMVNAVNMNVTWSRSDLNDSLVHLYGNHKDLNTDQNPFYRGRTAVFKEELKNGDVSLKLSNVRITDEGEYTCRVDSKFWEDSKTTKLSVEAVGSEPVITVEKYESGKFTLLCESKGWYPEPELQWKNSKGVNVTAETETQEVADLFNVKSRITVEEIDSYYCSVTQRVHEKEERIDAQSLHESESH
ncbi:butyrophilin-like protein 2 isoform X1 [Astyanax mexicanus]|uniref:butyrophilin-like protein 2 isoform X1 n=1 Tax=Astyanax mexicanus TaxID=7994 RepID=UPI0020CB5A69|nr:butyrophilin-like protein 2 isoform X1 [Astyanax mexicanus]